MTWVERSTCHNATIFMEYVKIKDSWMGKNTMQRITTCNHCKKKCDTNVNY